MKPVYRNAECRGGAYAKLPKASNSSKIRAQGMENTRQKKCFPLSLESIKHFLWPAPSLRGGVRNQYTARPNSSRIHAKQNAVEEPMRTARTAQQDSSPCSCLRHAKHKPEKRQAKNGAFATLPHGAETAASKP